MPDTTVRYYDATMSGAPALSGTAGALIGVLDACLVNGFGSVTLDSLVIAANVATATVSTGHNFALLGNTGPVIEISGATPAGLNGEWRISAVPSSTQFTFTTSGISDQTATGTITAKRAPAGFSKVFSGTNKAAYQADDLASTRLYCRIDDTGTTNARIRGYETMSGVNTGTGLFPTQAQLSGGGYVYKSNGATARDWMLISDGRMVYFLCDPTGIDSGAGSDWNGGFVFGDVISYAGVDAFHALLIASGAGDDTLPLPYLGSPTYSWLARSYTQLGTAITSARYSHGKNTGLGVGGQTYPAPVDNGLHLWPVECWESTTLARGMMPGLWNPVHNSDTPHGSFIDTIAGLTGRTIRVNTTGNTSYEVAFDITGPWR